MTNEEIALLEEARACLYGRASNLDVYHRLGKLIESITEKTVGAPESVDDVVEQPKTYWIVAAKGIRANTDVSLQTAFECGEAFINEKEVWEFFNRMLAESGHDQCEYFLITFLLEITKEQYDIYVEEREVES